MVRLLIAMLRRMALCAALGLAWFGLAVAQGQKFDIQRFDIRGNTLLPPEQAEAAVAPFVGQGRDYGDVQKALESLENAYRAKGYGTVSVHVPEQEITSGAVRLDVKEGVLGAVAVEGNQFFDEANVRASVPRLREGAAPNLREISESVQLANENPAKQIEVTLAAGTQEGKVDAKVKVTDEKPQHFFLTYDNSGTVETGRHRLGVAYQHANLLGNDEVMTLAYTTSPDVWLDHPDGVKVDVYSVAFRKPFYSIGDSLDVIYANSSVNVPSSVLALGSPFGIIGKGEVLALRWNHFFPRRGEYSSRLILGFDSKYVNSTCDPDQRGTVGSCTPYTLRPLSATYGGQWERVREQGSYNVGIAWNAFPTGSVYAGAPGTAAAGKNDRYSFIAGRPVSDDFAVLRYGATYARLVEAWLLRAAVSGQQSHGGLPSVEQIGLAGAYAVRGFDERIIAADTGHVVNLEAYTPDLANHIGIPGVLHALVFYDFARGRNVGAQGAPFDDTGIASVGVGLRYGLQKDVSVSIDVADVLDKGRNGTTEIGKRNSWGGHFRVSFRF